MNVKGLVAIAIIILNAASAIADVEAESAFFHKIVTGLHPKKFSVSAI